MFAYSREVILPKLFPNYKGFIISKYYFQIKLKELNDKL